MSAGLHRPARVCGALLGALEASEGRRKQRKRDQTPDAIGLAVKRALLQRAVEEDPDPECFEEWLLGRIDEARGATSAGAVSAMARAVLEEWRLAHDMQAFAAWLERGAPSEDATGETAPVKRAATPPG
jgi:hypothetical protein